MISVEHLTKCYGDFMAVDDLSFEIEEGHVSAETRSSGKRRRRAIQTRTKKSSLMPVWESPRSCIRSPKRNTMH